MGSEPDDIIDLIAAARKGNQAACRELIDRHQRQIAATVYGILGVCNEAEDIGQETFMRFFASLDQFRGESSVTTYLTRIAVNLCINEIRKRQRHRLVHWVSTHDNLEQVPEENWSKSTSIEQITVHNALQKLKPKYRSVLVLRLMSGYSTSETAAILSLPLGTVLSRLSRAQDQIRQILDPTGKEKTYVNPKKIKSAV